MQWLTAASMHCFDSHSVSGADIAEEAHDIRELCERWGLTPKTLLGACPPPSRQGRCINLLCRRDHEMWNLFVAPLGQGMPTPFMGFATSRDSRWRPLGDCHRRSHRGSRDAVPDVFRRRRFKLCTLTSAPFRKGAFAGV